MEISKSKYEEMYRKVSKLAALEAGGVDNWEFYDEALSDWYKENEIDEAVEDFFQYICDEMIDGLDHDFPAGREAGISWNWKEDAESSVKRKLKELIKGK